MTALLLYGVIALVLVIGAAYALGCLWRVFKRGAGGRSAGRGKSA